MFALVCWGRVGLHTFDALKFHIRKLSRVSVTSIIQVIQCIWVAPAARANGRRRIPQTPNRYAKLCAEVRRRPASAKYGVDLVKACVAAAAAVKVCWRPANLLPGRKGPPDVRALQGEDDR
jgi:hypothetical protein